MALQGMESGKGISVMMPYVDGIEVCRRIRAKGDRVPILMLTAKAAVGDRVEAIGIVMKHLLTRNRLIISAVSVKRIED